MSPASPETLYHSIPQAPVASGVIDLDGDEPAEISNGYINTRIRWIQFILGCALLLPWNALITATPYFLSRLAQSPLKSTFSSYLSTTFIAANFIFLAHATATSRQMSLSRRTMISLLSLSVLSFLLTLSTLIAFSPGIFFMFVILNGIAQSAIGSYLQTSLMAVASLFGPTAVQASLSGQAAVAVLVSSVQVLSALGSVDSKPKPSDSSRSDQAEEKVAFIFFGFSTIFLLVAAASQKWLVSMPVYHTVAGGLEKQAQPEDDTDDEHRSLVPIAYRLSQSFTERQRIWRIAKKNIVFEIGLASVFVVTYAVFPPITAFVQPTNPNMHPLLFTSIHFLVFNSGDFLGRYICSFPRLCVWSGKWLLVCSLSRTLFIVLFLLCNVERPNSSSIPAVPIINSDFMFMLLLLAFGLSNGYVSSMCLMSGASLEHNPKLRGRREDIDIAATVLQFFLVGGGVLGAIASFVVRGAVCACNPFIE